MIKIITLTLFISINLIARLNPFEADPSMTETKMNMKPIKVENVFSEDDGNKTVQVKSQETKSLLIKKVIKEIELKEKKVIIAKPKPMVKERIIKAKEKVVVTPEHCKVEEIKMPIKVAKPKPVIVKFAPNTYKILPFLTIDVDYDKINMFSRTKYNIVTYHVLKDKNKIAFDYSADVWFYSRYKQLNSPSFVSYELGNHRGDNFFRVAFTLNHPVEDYEIIIKNHKVSIEYKK